MGFAPIRRFRLANRKRERARIAEARWVEIQSVMSLIGQITVTWAGVERMLDELIAWYQHSATSLEQRHPWGLRGKLDYLERLHGDARLPAGMRQFVQRVREEGERLGERRHELIHGLTYRRALVGGAWQSQRVVYDKALARITIRNFNNSDFQDLLRDVTEFAGYLSPRVWAIALIDSGIAPPPGIDLALRDLDLPPRV